MFSLLLEGCETYVGKQFMKPRLTNAIRAVEDYSPTQYGFRRAITGAIEEVVEAVKLAKAYMPLSWSGAACDPRFNKRLQLCKGVPHA